jgi:hypothetical protein
MFRNGSSIALFVGEEGRWKTPLREKSKSGLYPLAWKSRKGGGISTSPTAAATTTTSRDSDVCVRKK